MSHRIALPDFQILITKLENRKFKQLVYGMKKLDWWICIKNESIRELLSCQPKVTVTSCFVYNVIRVGAQWLSGRVLDSRPKGRGFEPHGVTALWSLSKTHLF